MRGVARSVGCLAVALVAACATVPMRFVGAYMRDDALRTVRDGGQFAAADHASLLIDATEVVIEGGGDLQIFEIVAVQKTPFGVDLQVRETQDAAAVAAAEVPVVPWSLRLEGDTAVASAAQDTWVRIADAIPAAGDRVATSVTTAALFSRGYLVDRRPWVIVGSDQPGSASLRRAGEENWVPFVGSFEAAIGGDRGREPLVQLGDETYELHQRPTGVRLVPATTASTDSHPGAAVIEMEEMADPPFLILANDAALLAAPDPGAAVLGRVEYLQPVGVWQRGSAGGRAGAVEGSWYLVQAGPLVGWLFGSVLGQRLRPVQIPAVSESYATWEVEAVDSDLRLLFGRNANGPLCAFGGDDGVVEMEQRAERCHGPGERDCSTDAAPVWRAGEWASAMLLDLNRDAVLDPVCVFHGPRGLAFCPALSTGAGNGAEPFVAAGCYATAADAVTAVTVADHDSDGHADLHIGETWVRFDPVAGCFGACGAARLVYSTPAELVGYAREVRRDEAGRLTMLSVAGIDAGGLAQVAGHHQLAELYVTGSRLASLPDVLAQLTGLTKLYVENGDLQRVPPLVARLPLLEDLDLEGNRLREVGPDLFAAVGLKRLDLSRNQLTELPPQIGDLAELRSLDLASNQLRSLPPAIADLARLERIEIYGNQLDAVPEALRGLTALRELGLGRNLVSELPAWAGEFVSLEKLDLANNRLVALPSAIGALKRLRWLDLRANRLTALPGSIGRLVALERLDLRGNPLPALPRALRRLGALRELSWGRGRCTRSSDESDESINDFITRCARIGANR